MHPGLCPLRVTLQSARTFLRHLSLLRCIKLALVHDVAEAIVGDITPTCGVSDEEKFALEAGAVGRIKAMLGGAGCLPGGAAPPFECGWKDWTQRATFGCGGPLLPAGYGETNRVKAPVTLLPHALQPRRLRRCGTSTSRGRRTRRGWSRILTR